MIGLSAGLEVAKKALSAYQLALEVYSNNIANVNTPGYSRRTPRLKESAQAQLPFGRIGLGVDVASVSRMRDKFLDFAYRKESSSVGRYDSMEEALSEVETALNEPSDVNLGNALTQFWESWQELANQPESSTARGAVASTASALARALGQTATQLTDLRTSLDNEITGSVQDINSIASKIGELNGEIIKTQASGGEASDLADQRDALLDQLSNLATISVSESKDGSVSVSIGSEALVERSTVVPLSVVERADDGLSIADVKVVSGTRNLSIAGGKLAGLLESRDSIIPKYMSKLDEVANALVQSVNAAHRSGYDLNGKTGGDFFDPAGTTAATIQVASAILNDPSLIAASADTSVGNGDNALAISDLRLKGQLGDSNATIDDYYNSMIGSLGVESSSAKNQKETEDLLLQEISSRRESVTGVSLDEETTNLIATQHAYQAATKVVSIVDSLMASLIDAM
ncbi:MAG TPA: flagellar hook-associated protein FlgK [bacterium]|nr:flagellar hook-associated protein FlgK [bacterium]